MKHLGDYKEDAQYLDFTFTTNDSTGLPTVLTGTPSLAVYKQNSDVQSAAGVTLTPDFDSVVGLNQVRIDLSADAFYEVGADYSIVIAAGTVDGISVVGYTVATFSIENRFGLTAAAVWAYGTRTLSSFGTLVADIWAYATRVLTAATNLTSDGSTIPTAAEMDTELTSTHGADSWQTDSSAAGVGPVTVNIVDQFAAPVVSADVVITDTVGSGNYFGADTTDANGDATIDALATGNYTIASSLIGYDIPDTAVTIAAAAQTVNIVATKSTANAPVDPSLGLLYGDTVKITGTAAVGVEVLAKKTSEDVVYVDSNAVTKYERKTVTDSDGRFEFELLKNVELTITIAQIDYEEEITLTGDVTNLEDAT